MGGWLLAELYDSKRLPGPPPHDDGRPLPPHLPGIGATTPYEKECALAAHVGAIGKAATIIPDRG